MNNGYYQNPVFPGVPLNNSSVPNQQSVPSYEMTQSNNTPITSEQSYIENRPSYGRGCIHKCQKGLSEYQSWNGVS